MLTNVKKTLTTALRTVTTLLVATTATVMVDTRWILMTFTLAMVNIHAWTCVLMKETDFHSKISFSVTLTVHAHWGLIIDDCGVRLYSCMGRWILCIPTKKCASNYVIFCAHLQISMNVWRELQSATVMLLVWTSWDPIPVLVIMDTLEMDLTVPVRLVMYNQLMYIMHIQNA